MKKPSILFLSITALLLAGCTAPATTGSEPAATPSSSSSEATVSQEPAPTVSPRPTPKPVPASTPVPTPPVAAPAPAVAPPAGAPAPAPQPVPAPQMPQPAPFIPEAPQPVAPVGPPAVQPAFALPVVPAAQSYPDLVPVPEWDAVRAVREAGTSWNVSGGGYPPGAEIHVFFGPKQSDYQSIEIPVAHADATGHYSVRVTLSADFTPGSYGFMVWYKPFSEDFKRYASVEVTAPS